MEHYFYRQFSNRQVIIPPLARVYLAGGFLGRRAGRPDDKMVDNALYLVSLGVEKKEVLEI